MWLDGLYMGQPFYAEYAMLAHEDTAFNDIANQFIWMEKHARDAKTGLLYHAWDESKQMKWADTDNRYFSTYSGQGPWAGMHGTGRCAGLFSGRSSQEKRTDRYSEPAC